MAQRIQTLLIDDLDGGEAAGTVRFGLDGTECEIDLSAAHGDELCNLTCDTIGRPGRGRLADLLVLWFRRANVRTKSGL